MDNTNNGAVYQVEMNNGYDLWLFGGTARQRPLTRRQAWAKFQELCATYPTHNVIVRDGSRNVWVKWHFDATGHAP